MSAMFAMFLDINSLGIQTPIPSPDCLTQAAWICIRHFAGAKLSSPIGLATTPHGIKLIPLTLE